MAADGRRKIADGKHTFAALREVERMVKADPEKEWQAALLDALEQGVDVQVVNFEDVDQLFIWTVAAHDVENNRFKATSLKDLVATVERFRKKVPGGDWKATQALRHSASGCQKRPFSRSKIFV